MNKDFKWGKFILDCFICFGLMIASIIIFIKPLYHFYASIGKGGGIRLFGNEFYSMALEFSVIPLILFIIIYLLSKKNIIKYRIYKQSFWFVFITLNTFWWFIAHWLSHNFKVLS